MKRLIIGFALVVLILLPIACARAPESAVAPAPMPEGVPAPAPAPMPAPAPAPPPPGRGDVTVDEAGSGELVQSWATERMIIRTGNIVLIVEDIEVVIDQITVLTSGMDGYVVSSQKWRDGDRLVGSIAIRVPAEQFSMAMRALRNLAVEVRSESISSKDVTEEYVDLSSKLKNLEATEEQLLRLMEKGETVEEILKVQRELSNTRADIEQTKGRMQYLERTSETSLIEVILEQSKLDVKLTASSRSVKEGEDIRFDADIAGGFAPFSYEWDFGDGNTSTSERPRYSYDSPGTYTVKLTVVDDHGNTDYDEREQYITVLPGWSAGNVASSAWNGLVTFGRVVINILIWVGIFSPVWIIIGGIVYWRLRRRRKRQLTG